MKLENVKIGDLVAVSDWSYSVNPETERSDLSHLKLENKYEVVDVARGSRRFPGKSFTQNLKTGQPLIRFNNVRIKNVENGNEFYIKSRFLVKLYIA